MSSKSHQEMSANLSPRADEIELTGRFSEQMAELCMNVDYSDVTFIVEEQRLPAHRVILAARSEYFRAMLYGGMAEATQSEIHLKIQLDAFKALLKYIYSGLLPLAHMDEDCILDTLGLANQYGFTELELAISDYLRQYLSLTNVCPILDAARLYNLATLTKVCLMFMDRNATEMLTQPSFRTLTVSSLQEVLRRDSFYATEVSIFLAVSEWCRHNPNVDVQTIVSCVRLPLMKLEHLLKVVRPSGILEPDKLLDAIEEQTVCKQLPYRAALFPDENVAISKYMARVIQGENRATLLDGDYHHYDIEKGYSRHIITESNDNCIMVELGSICTINHIKMLLWDLDSRSYSYFIEVAVQLLEWERVVDYSKYLCRSWQFVYFEPRPVRYIKLVGTHNTNNSDFHVVGMEAMYSNNMPKVIKDIVAPTANVATVEMSALVSIGVSRTRNALLNGDYLNYDWDSGYTCHQLGSGEILVRLGQPYYIGSMRLLLWDCDDRTYSFYIETSMDEIDWHMVVDMREHSVRSWQNCVFTPRPMIFIRIVGTRNTANEIFHCVHLECPTQDLNFLQLEAERVSETATATATDGQCTGLKTSSSSASSTSSTSNASNASSSNARPKLRVAKRSADKLELGELEDSDN